MSNLIAPQEPGDLNYNQVVEKLTSHFKPKKLKIAERFHFYEQNQLKSENVADHLAELQRLALTYEFDNFLDEALCDRFMSRLLEEAIQRRFLAEGDLILTKALTLAQSMEMTQKDLKEIHSTGWTVARYETKVHTTYLARSNLFVTDVWEQGICLEHAVSSQQNVINVIKLGILLINKQTRQMITKILTKGNTLGRT